MAFHSNRSSFPRPVRTISRPFSLANRYGRKRLFSRPAKFWRDETFRKCGVEKKKGRRLREKRASHPPLSPRLGNENESYRFRGYNATIFTRPSHPSTIFGPSLAQNDSQNTITRPFSDFTSRRLTHLRVGWGRDWAGGGGGTVSHIFQGYAALTPLYWKKKVWKYADEWTAKGKWARPWILRRFTPPLKGLIAEIRGVNPVVEAVAFGRWGEF